MALGAEEYRGDARDRVLALSPITAAALGIALLGEPVTVQMMAGVVCVGSGAVVGGWGGVRQVQPPIGGQREACMLLALDFIYWNAPFGTILSRNGGNA